MYPVSMPGARPQHPSRPPPGPPSSMSPYPQAQNVPQAATPGTMPLGQVDMLSDAQVDEMLRDDAKLTEFVRTLPLVQDYMLRAEAVNRLENEVRTMGVRTGNAELDGKRAELERLRAQCDAKLAEKQQLEGRVTRDALVDGLTDAIKAVDAECEDIAAEFLAGNMTAKEFTKKYMEKRVLFHTRSAKKESYLLSRA